MHRRAAGYPRAVKLPVASGLRGSRVSLVGSYACAVVVLLLVSHELRPVLEPGHDHGSAAVGLCFVVLGVLVPLIVAVIPPRPASVVPVLSTAPLLPAPARPLRKASTRASPVWLQRFRN